MMGKEGGRLKGSGSTVISTGGARPCYHRDGCAPLKLCANFKRMGKMRSRCKLAVSKLQEYIEFAVSIGWVIGEPRSFFEVARLERNGTIAIVHRKISTNNGNDIVHLTTWGESAKIFSEWMKARNA